MKFTAIALIASAQAVDLSMLSACQRAGAADVTCSPQDFKLFATGMNGDEDLGEDITMKGEKFHYNQRQALAQDVEEAAWAYPAQDATEPKRKDSWNAGYDAPEKVHTLDPKIAKKATTFYAQY